VAERHRLIRTLALPRHPRGTLQFIQANPERDNDEAGEHQARPGQRVRTTVKNLRHECFLLPLRRFRNPLARELLRSWCGDSFKNHAVELRLA
jgi:hypothetical protein